MVSTDVFVVGGGPAGLASAIAARRAGLRVALADALHPPVDKACGEGLMPDAVEAARAVGIALPAADGFPFRGIRFLQDAVSTEAVFPSGAGIGLRRTVLHQALADQAQQAGVDLRWGCSVTSLEAFAARWIIGADGLRSRVRTWAGLDSGSRKTHRFGFRAHYRIAPWSEYVEVYWAPGFQVYVTPVACDQVCVALISRDPHFRLEQALPSVPALRDRLAGAELLTAERGAPSFSRRLKAVAHGRVALIGDASGSVDAVTGEGINIAFRQARALASALAAGDLGRYEAAHRRLLRCPRRMGAALLSLDRFPAFRTPALRTFAAYPALFRRLLAIHVGSSGVVHGHDVFDTPGLAG